MFFKYDLDGDGHLDYSEFLRLVNFAPKSSSSSSSDRDRDRDRDVDRDRDRGRVALTSQQREEVEMLTSRIRRRLEDNLGSSASSARRIKETFADIDDDNSGALSKREVGRALEVLRVEVSARELDLLFSRFDENGDGQINYTEFLQMIDFRPQRQSVESKY